MHPYENLDEKFFWATAVARRNMFDIADLWDPRFNIGKNTKVATFGSCFAQHIGRALRRNGFNWLITEPTPAGLNTDSATKFNYDVFSARTGNIYTASLFSQWVNWAVGDESIPSEIWRKGDRFFDPFRPNIEPNGFETPMPGLSVSSEGLPMKDVVQEFQKQLIVEALRKTGWIQKDAAKLLEVKPTTLNEMIKRYGIRAEVKERAS